MTECESYRHARPGLNCPRLSAEDMKLAGELLLASKCAEHEQDKEYWSRVRILSALSFVYQANESKKSKDTPYELQWTWLRKIFGLKNV